MALDPENGSEGPRESPVPVNKDQAEAMCRLLIDSGDMTPMAYVQLRKLWEAP